MRYYLHRFVPGQSKKKKDDQDPGVSALKEFLYKVDHLVPPVLLEES